MPNKYGPIGGLGALLAQIGGDRGARSRKQREHIGASALGSDKADRSLGPIDVFETQVDDLAGS